MTSMTVSRRQFFQYSTGAALATLPLTSAFGNSNGKVVVVYNYGNELHSTITDALLTEISDSRIQRMDIFQTSYLATSLSGDPASLIVGIGNEAATSLVENRESLGDTTLCLAALSDRDVAANLSPAIGTLIQPDYEEYFLRLKSVLPDISTLGYMTSGEDSDRWKTIESAVKNHDMKLIRYQISKREEISDALTYLSRRSDVLFAGEQPDLFNAYTARHILVFCLRHRMPIVGPNAGWVRNGSVFSVAYDYKALGQSYGSACKQLLATEQQHDSQWLAVPAEAQQYLINKKSAEIYRLRVNDNSPEDVMTYE